MKQVQLFTKNQIPEVACLLVNKLKKSAVMTFTGPLGAGKTTLIQSILQQLGVVGPITSPTYTYVCVYDLPDGKKVYHFDLYRFTSLDEFIQAGFDEYLNQPDSYCLIEWPGVIQELLQDAVVAVKLDHVDENTRKIEVL